MVWWKTPQGWAARGNLPVHGVLLTFEHNRVILKLTLCFSPPDLLTLSITLMNLGLTPRNMPWVTNSSRQPTTRFAKPSIACQNAVLDSLISYPLVFQNQQPGGTARHCTFSSTHNIGWLLVLKYNRFCNQLTRSEVSRTQAMVDWRNHRWLLHHVTCAEEKKSVEDYKQLIRRRRRRKPNHGLSYYVTCAEEKRT